MSQTLRAIYACALCVLALEGFSVAQAQMLNTEGDEFVLSGQLPGDQVFPSMDLSPDGGWVVWIDNAISSEGPGVGAMRISPSLNGIGEIYQIAEPSSPTRNSRRGKGKSRRSRRNSHSAPTIPGTISNPDVARLPDGGAAITWQKGPVGQSESFIRFVDADGEPLSEEISLSPGLESSTTTERVSQLSWRRNRQRNTRWRIKTESSYLRDRTQDVHPVILPDGTTVVVYSGVRRIQTNSFEIVTKVSSRTRRGRTSFSTNDVLQAVSTTLGWGHDVFFQRFDSEFNPIGEETMVNEFVLHNQRNPEIAVLPNGSFVVVWVSENNIPALPTDAPDVCVHGRLYDASGSPLGNEFKINTGPNVCARPVVAASQDGGFTVAWNQRGDIQNNGWDINARSFDGQGAPQGDAFLVNERTFGDQYSPSIAMIGLNQLIAWTSMGQDGSREGIFARLIMAGTPSGAEFRVNGTTAGKQIHPVVAANGLDKFVVAWSHFNGETSFDIMGQIFQSTQPWPAPAAPMVLAISESDLQVTWDAYLGQGLTAYELYVDGSTSPLLVTETSYELHGLEAESVHTFQLAYLLQNGGRSLLSDIATGMTLPVPGAITEPSSESSGSNGSTVPPALIGLGEPGSAGEGLPSINLVASVRDGKIVLSWNTVPGADYQVQVSYDFEQWFDLGDLRHASSENDSLEMSPKERAAFFRVLKMP